MQLPCASRRLAGGTNVVAVEAGSALSLCIWLVCGHKLAKWTTNPITRLCSPWLPLHFRLCPLIRDLSKSPNQISPIPPLLSSLLFLSVPSQFVFLFSSIMISSIVSCSLRKFFLSSYVYSNIFRPAPGSKEGPILRVVGSENSKLGNYKVNGRQGKAQIRMDPRGTSINSLPRFPRSRFEPLNQKIEFNLHIPRTDPSFFFNRLFFRETFLRISIFFFFLLN